MENTNLNNQVTTGSSDIGMKIVVFGLSGLGLFFLLALSAFGYVFAKSRMEDRAASERVESSRADEKVKSLEQSVESLTAENEQLKKEIEEQKAKEEAVSDGTTTTESSDEISKSKEPTASVPATPAPTTPKASCVTYKIYDGKFESEKCYTTKDYQDLAFYLSRYNSYVFEYNSASSTANMTCDGSDFFKDSCENAEDRMDDAKDKMGEYESKIKAIIARGKD